MADSQYHSGKNIQVLGGAGGSGPNLRNGRGLAFRSCQLLEGILANRRLLLSDQYQQMAIEGAPGCASVLLEGATAVINNTTPHPQGRVVVTY
jgi:hypothetical protein